MLLLYRSEIYLVEFKLVPERLNGCYHVSPKYTLWNLNLQPLNPCSGGWSSRPKSTLWNLNSFGFPLFHNHITASQICLVEFELPISAPMILPYYCSKFTLVKSKLWSTAANGPSSELTSINLQFPPPTPPYGWTATATLSSLKYARVC